MSRTSPGFCCLLTASLQKSCRQRSSIEPVIAKQCLPVDGPPKSACPFELESQMESAANWILVSVSVSPVACAARATLT